MDMEQRGSKKSRSELSDDGSPSPIRAIAPANAANRLVEVRGQKPLKAVALVANSGAAPKMVAAVAIEAGPLGPVDTPSEIELAEQIHAASRRRHFLTAVPSWLISLVVHVALILILAAITLDPVQTAISILNARSSEVAAEIQEFELDSPSIEDVSMEAFDAALPTPQDQQVVSMPQVVSPTIATIEPMLDALETNKLTESILPSSILKSGALAQMSVALSSRSAAGKSELLERFGGTAASEKAVALALKWIAEHQANDGGWSFAHNAICRNQCDEPGSLDEARNGATAMALLPFLGAGQTHLEGQYQETVKRGLAYLINRMQVTRGQTPSGSWHEPGGRMYSHGLAAITVCEAYAMTRDPDLLQPAQLSLNFLVYAQDPRGGGWRYEPQRGGDTSVVGWCVMALKSGKMGSLVVPQQTFAGASRFLDFVSTNNGAYYGYDRPTSDLGGRGATISVGLLCRMYLGWPKEHPGLQEGIKHLSERGPDLDDLYYTYYATQVMRHQGGPQWERWNRQMRDALVNAQEKSGHVGGSWTTGGRHARQGGRLYATSLATMILEVYYRHMPLYSEKSSADDFEI